MKKIFEQWNRFVEQQDETLLEQDSSSNFKKIYDSVASKSKKIEQLEELNRITRESFSHGLKMPNSIPKPSNLEEIKRQVEEALVPPEAPQSDVSERREKKPTGQPLPEKVINTEIIETADEAYWVTLLLSEKSNLGLKSEEALIAWYLFEGLSDAAQARTRQYDIDVGGFKLEVKTSKKGTPNYQFNSSAVPHDDKKFYVFVLFSASKPTFYYVSSALLFEIITFSFAGAPGSKELEENIRGAVARGVEDFYEGIGKGVKSIDELIVNTVLEGNPTEVESKNISIGNSALSARVRIMFSLGDIAEMDAPGELFIDSDVGKGEGE